MSYFKLWKEIMDFPPHLYWLCAFSTLVKSLNPSLEEVECFNLYLGPGTRVDYFYTGTFKHQTFFFFLSPGKDIWTLEKHASALLQECLQVQIMGTQENWL